MGERGGFKVSKFRGREGPIRGLGTDHVISEPMRGKTKFYPMAQTDRQTDIAILRLNQPSDKIKTSLNVLLSNWKKEKETYT